MSALIINLLTLHHPHPKDKRMNKHVGIYDSIYNAFSLETSRLIKYIND